MEKQPLIDEERLDADGIETAATPTSQHQHPRQRNISARRQFAIALVATLSGLFLLRIMFGLAGSLHPFSVSSWTLGCHGHHASSSSSSDHAAPATDRIISDIGTNSSPKLVPLEAHIMVQHTLSSPFLPSRPSPANHLSGLQSKCPDARDCLHDLVIPAMERVSSYVNFTLSYIGTPTYDDDGVACMHGPTECLGNILELCAATIYPDPKYYLGFTMCLSNEYARIPGRDLVSDCALEHGMSFAELNECASADSGAQGVDLLRKSVERSQEAGVKKSCTVRLDGEVRCVRDGGVWYDCEGGEEWGDLVKDVERLYERYNQV
ncbi:MAG: hypothetical protein M1819_001289 [Sarea resinae]|nr:MAG: hypothetical protein M1819_001289 [Sarea resinae]